MSSTLARTVRVALVAILMVAVIAGFAHAQEVRASLFPEADRALQRALDARADILAPRSFAEGMKHYREAEKDLNEGKNLEDIRRKLARAIEHLRRATEATELAHVTLRSSLAARDDAEAAEAATYATSLWNEAEEKFTRAARELEGGDVNDARENSAEAERLYRDAELEAIKTNYLQETWDLLEHADRLDVEDRAPETLERARTLVDRAESMLNEQRYNTDEPRALAQQAKYEARHAIYLAGVVRAVDRDETTIEELVLSAENALRRIAGEMGIAAEFEEGLAAATEAIVGKVQAYQDTINRLRNRSAEYDAQVASLEARVAEMEEELGGVREERSELAERVEAQRRLRETFARVERMFDRSEARVLREGDDVIIRLIGLNFPVGEANIGQGYFGLLTKVQAAIRTFPDARITITGHTDSFGGDELNQKLSQERADAVRQYLLANMSFDPARMDAIGYGETQPVASNETPEGRTRNRRIDVIIHPRLQSQ